MPAGLTPESSFTVEGTHTHESTFLHCILILRSFVNRFFFFVNYAEQYTRVYFITCELWMPPIHLFPQVIRICC